MTAPALILLGSSSRDQRAARISHEIRNEVLAIRPQLDISVAFADDEPTALQAGQALVKRRVEEAVVVPLALSEAFSPADDAVGLLAQLRAGLPRLSVVTARPIGPEAGLLAVVDRRLRDALRARRVGELDALVFAAGGSRDVRSNSLVCRRARQWATHHRLPHLAAFAFGSGPSAGEAIRTLRAQGRRHIAVGSWFLAPDEVFARQAAQAQEAGAVAVSSPVGAGPEIAETVLARYVVAALELVDIEASEAGPEAASARHLSVVGA